MSRFKKVWTDPVWSKVIASAIFGAVLYVPTAYGLWPDLWTIVKAGWGLLLSPSAVPNWLVGLGVVSVILWVIQAISAIRDGLASINPGEAWRSYKTDVFYGLRWQWKYADNGDIARLIPLCGQCSYQLHPHAAGGYSVISRIAFHCDICAKDSQEFDGDFQDLKDKVIRMIHQKLRTNTWNQVEADHEEKLNPDRSQA